MWIAILHVVGALSSTIAFGVFALAVEAWEQERVHKRRLQQAAIFLGVPVVALERDSDLLPALQQYAARRSTDELLRNRVADLCGVVRTGWGWLANLLQVGIVVGMSWYLYSEGAQAAVVMWTLPAVAVFFWFTSVTFSFLCVLLTGRYPGEPKLARRAVAASIAERTAPPR